MEHNLHMDYLESQKWNDWTGTWLCAYFWCGLLIMCDIHQLLIPCLFAISRLKHIQHIQSSSKCLALIIFHGNYIYVSCFAHSKMGHFKEPTEKEHFFFFPACFREQMENEPWNWANTSWCLVVLKTKISFTWYRNAEHRKMWANRSSRDYCLFLAIRVQPFKLLAHARLSSRFLVLFLKWHIVEIPSSENAQSKHSKRCLNRWNGKKIKTF